MMKDGERIAALDYQKKLEAAEKACAKALIKFTDTNSFFRSAGARELIALGKEGFLLKTGDDNGTLDPNVWNLILRAAIEYQGNYDSDVRKFALEVMRLMNAPKNKQGIYEYREDEGSRLRKAQSKIQASVKKGLSDGQPVYHSYNPWRSALLRSIRNNRTVPCMSMELISVRDNRTAINRVVKFRGFVLEGKGAAKDRLYTVVDGRIEKAEQNDGGVETGEAVLKWNFKHTAEKYTITGRLKVIREFQGVRKYHQMEDVKFSETSADEADLQFRRIAWNMCSDVERDMFFYPKGQNEDPEHKHLNTIMRRALQGLCIDLETFEARDPADVFKQMDLDGSGMLNFEELITGLRSAHVIMDDADVDLLFRSMDNDGSGEIEYSEFSKALERMEISPNFWVMYLEPYLVERHGRGGAYGDKGDTTSEDFLDWIYELQDDGTWDYFFEETK